MQTCKVWAQIGTEFMYRTILVCGPKALLEVCALFDRKSYLGIWTKAIYVKALKSEDNVVTLGMEDPLSSLIRQCPNLRYFNVACPLSSAFRSIIGTLRFYCARSLTSVEWNVPCDSQARIIAAVASMRSLVSLNIDLSGPQYDSGRTMSGYGCLVNVALPDLKELVLRGSIQDFSEEIPSWDLPSLRTLVLDFGSVDCDIPDILDILGEHGAQLTTLDVNCRIPFDVSSILELCSNLRTFCFNLDWRLDGALTKTPHAHLERIGMHGLQYAFGVGIASKLASLRFIEATVLRNRNDINFASLNQHNFPSLRLIRVLDPEILRGLNANNGPAKGGPGHCYERWERWWEMCARMRVRLEDCTGALLGTLPIDEDGEDWDEEGEEEEGFGEYGDYGDYDDYEEDMMEYDNHGPAPGVSNPGVIGSDILQDRPIDAGTSAMSNDHSSQENHAERQPSPLVTVS